MDDKHKKFLIKEAQDSFRILIQFIGMLDSKANFLFLKWPDAMQSLISGDMDLFRKDMAILICQPLRILALSLREYASTKLVKSGTTQDIELVVEQALIDPMATKKALIAICNTEVFLLKAAGQPIEPIKETIVESHYMKP